MVCFSTPAYKEVACTPWKQVVKQINPLLPEGLPVFALDLNNTALLIEDDLLTVFQMEKCILVFCKIRYLVTLTVIKKQMDIKALVPFSTSSVIIETLNRWVA